MTRNQSPPSQDASNRAILNHESAMPPTLSARQTELARQEIMIKDGIHSLVLALTEIHNRKLYSEDFETFEDYCNCRWGFSRQRAYQLITAGKTLTEMSTNVDIEQKNGRPVPAFLPSNEAQLRALASLTGDPQVQLKLWSEAVVKANGKPPSAAAIIKMNVRVNAVQTECESPLVQLSQSEDSKTLIQQKYNQHSTVMNNCLKNIELLGLEFIKIRDSKTYPQEYASMHDAVDAECGYEQWMVDMAIDVAEGRNLDPSQIDKLIHLSSQTID